jgi:hypothetical protein
MSHSYIGRRVRYVGSTNAYLTKNKPYNIIDYFEPPIRLIERQPWDAYTSGPKMKLVEDCGRSNWYYVDESFEWVVEEKEEKMFTKRQIIKCIDNQDNYLTIGKYYEVESMSTKSNEVTVVNDRGEKFTYPLSKFETADSNEKKLQDLLAKANEGRKALVELYQLAPKRLMSRSPTFKKEFQPYKDYMSPKLMEYSLAEKVKLEPFYLSLNNYKVELVKNTFGEVQIKVGCKQFYIKELKRVLNDLIFMNCDWSDFNQNSAVQARDNATATRIGIKYGGNHLTWADAEILYNKIKDL